MTQVVFRRAPFTGTLAVEWRKGYGRKIIWFYGGPYHLKPDSHLGVCLLERPESYFALWLPIPDFGVPKDERLTQAVVEVAIDLALNDKPVWIGCAGGIGRTGLFMSLIAKALGVQDPIGYVRRMYHPEAVETVEQERYVRDFSFEKGNPKRRKTNGSVI